MIVSLYNTVHPYHPDCDWPATRERKRERDTHTHTPFGFVKEEECSFIERTVHHYIFGKNKQRSVGQASEDEFLTLFRKLI